MGVAETADGDLIVNTGVRELSIVEQPQANTKTRFCIRASFLNPLQTRRILLLVSVTGWKSLAGRQHGSDM